MVVAWLMGVGMICVSTGGMSVMSMYTTSVCTERRPVIPKRKIVVGGGFYQTDVSAACRR